MLSILKKKIKKERGFHIYITIYINTQANNKIIEEYTKAVFIVISPYL